ncbi:MAG: LysM peptidoglycan-binding domain-containing protein [Prevotella sp.]|nr:LysM peptidoglycan-binding domain-containing protein [Prevotella sp.]
MRKILFLFVMWLAVQTASAQIAAKYQVHRGDTYASIAEKFGMTEGELRRKNSGKRHLYAGMTINVVDYYNGRPARISSPRESYDDRVDMDNYDSAESSYGSYSNSFLDDPDFQEAQRLEKMHKFKDAAKLYSKVIDRNPSAVLFFTRGVCYYQNKKWKKAISDFEYALNARDANATLRSECERYLDSAYEQRAISQERSANTWAGILTGVVAVGAVADALSHDKKDHGKGNRDGHQANGGQQRGGDRQQAGGQQRGGDRQQAGGQQRGGDRQQAGGQQRGGNNRQQTSGQQRGGNRPQGQRGNDERRGQRNRD